MKTDKKFKCVDFKHQAQGEIYKEIMNLGPGGEINYFRRKVEAGVFHDLWERLHGAPVTVGEHDKAVKH